MTRATTSNPSTWNDNHAWSRVIDNAISSGVSPANSNAVPAQSISRSRARERTTGSFDATKSTATIPIGTLTQNTHRHPGPSVRYPPSVGPITDDRPNTAPKTPLMRARCSGGKTSASTANVDANSTPPNTPCRARNATRDAMLKAVPHSAEAAMNPTIPASKNGFRPNMSPSLPATGTRAVDVIRYAVVTHA